MTESDSPFRRRNIHDEGKPRGGPTMTEQQIRNLPAGPKRETMTTYKCSECGKEIVRHRPTSRTICTPCLSAWIEKQAQRGYERQKKARKDTRFCEFLDTQTLEYYITTDRDGLAETARAEWRRRWKTDYPTKEGSK